jgi:hypothetical protein
MKTSVNVGISAVALAFWRRLHRDRGAASQRALR